MRGFKDEQERKEQCCGTCKYHQFEKGLQDWVCANAASIWAGDATDYKDNCTEWEERK